MPIAFDTNEVFRFVLCTDKAKEKEQPALLFHFPTCSETTEIARLFDVADTSKDVPTIIGATVDAMCIILCGWENFIDRHGEVRPYNPEKLPDILTLYDLSEIRLKLIRDMSYSELEKKRRALWPESTQDKSANVATVVA